MTKDAHKKISLIGGLIFIGLTFATGISIYWVMLKQPDYIMRLQTLMQKRARLIEKNIDEATINTQQIISLPLIQNLQQLNTNPNDTAILNDLEKLINAKLLEANFTGISIYNFQGRQLI